MRVAIALLLTVVVVAISAVSVQNTEPKLASDIYSQPEATAQSTDNLFHGFFGVRQDNTRPQNHQLHLFEYAANLDFYREDSGPFYIYIKDAGDYSNQWIERGLMVDIAAETGGALFTFNQRYFTNNLVTPNATFAELEFLSVEQTLSDIAVFISAMRIAHNGRFARVILWGSRYGATVAAWARKRYPHMIDHVWASSGIFEIESFTFSQYDLLQYTILSIGGAQCRDTVLNAFDVLDYLIEAGNGEYIQERLNLCRPVDTNSAADIAALYESHIQAIVTYFERHHSRGVNTFCLDMNVFPGDALNSFARWKLHVFQQELECVEHSYEALVANSAATSFEEPGLVSGRRQWYYLQCTQLGLFSITDDFTWLPNRLSIEYHLQKCVDVLGEEYQPILLQLSNTALRNEFGSLDQRITNVIYTNGAIDPWLYNGILFSRDQNTTVFTIDYHSVSADLDSLSSADPIALDRVKRDIRAQILEWSFL